MHISTRGYSEARLMLQTIRSRVADSWRSLPIPINTGQGGVGIRPPFMRQPTIESSSSSRDLDGSPTWSPPVKYRPSAFGMAF